MKIVKVLEHNGEMYRVGDFIKVLFDNGCCQEGVIKYFGETTDMKTEQVEDYLEFGKYMERLSDIISVERVN